MNSKKPSIRDVAALSGVSIATVSNVLSGRKPVNDDLQVRVRHAANKLGYQVDRAASQMRSGRSNVVAVLVPDLTDRFFSTIVSHLEMLAYNAGYDVVVASSRDDRGMEASRLEALLSWRPAGLIAVPCSDELPSAIVRCAGSMPVVLVDRIADRRAVADTVTIDNRDAGEVAARYLLEMGHRDIVIAGSSLSIAPIRERAEAASSQITESTELMPPVLELGSSSEGGAKLISRWLERHPIPGAVIALTNVTALAVLAALAAHRIALPSKTSLVAFDDDAWMAARNTGITAVRQPVDEIAGAAWRRLFFRMTSGADAPLLATTFTATLVVRASVQDLSDAKSRATGPRKLLASKSALQSHAKQVN